MGNHIGINVNGDLAEPVEISQGSGDLLFQDSVPAFRRIAQGQTDLHIHSIDTDIGDRFSIDQI